MRILSATHRNLEKMVAEGSFREDLFYRLNVLSLEVPPLRERGHDILLLARHFMQQACAQIQRPVCRLAPGTYPALLNNRWPGNVRQLQNVIFRAAAICESSLVDIGDLEIAGTAVARQNDGEVGSLEEAVEGFEKALLEKLYVSYPSTRQLAARLADLAHRHRPPPAQVRHRPARLKRAQPSLEYTGLPANQVFSTLVSPSCVSGTSNTSRSRTMKSACLPGSRLPIRRSRPMVRAALRV